MSSSSGHKVCTAILDLLAAASGVEYQSQRHPPASTATEAARMRDTPLHQGIKSMVVKYDSEFALFALRADREIRSRLIRTNLRVRRTRFATPHELLELTGLVPGAVPPFGAPILPLHLFADVSVLDHDVVTFTAGLKDFSISLMTRDWQALAQPQLISFSRASSS